MTLRPRTTAAIATIIAIILVAILLVVRFTRNTEVQGPQSPSPGPSLSTQPLPGSVPTLRFQGSGLEGGGFENVVAVDPSGSGLLLAGGDVSGFQRSTDWGSHWQTANGGITMQNEL